MPPGARQVSYVSGTGRARTVIENTGPLQRQWPSSALDCWNADSTLLSFVFACMFVTSQRERKSDPYVKLLRFLNIDD